MTIEDNDLISLVYTSSAAASFRETALENLLEESRRLNSARDITGMLLYRGERFIQVLEGPASLVRSLADRIGRDARHRDMRVLLEEPIESRRFAEWTMAYRPLHQHPDEAPAGFRDSFADLEDGEERSMTVRALQELTLWFRVRTGTLAPTAHG